MKTVRILLVILLASAIAWAVACSKSKEPQSPTATAQPAPMLKIAEKEKSETVSDTTASAGMDGRLQASQQAESRPAPENLALRGRKLIREGLVELKVKDNETARIKLEEMVKAAGGFVSNVSYNRYATSSQLEMTLRLPAEGFNSFVKSLVKIGQIENEATNVQDVTDQWIDLDRRIATDEKLAARLEDLIQNKSYQFKDLLQVEEKLANLRLDIERLEGEKRGMDDRIALSTLRVIMRQEVLQKIAPPDSVFAPLLNALENSGPNFKSSLRLMMKAAGLVISFTVVILPWLIIIALIGLVIILFVKRRKKGAK